jgi:hypothetical protein
MTTDPNAPELIIVGRVRKAHGIRGDLVVEPMTDEPDAVFAPGRRVFAGTASGNRARDGADDRHHPEVRSAAEHHEAAEDEYAAGVGEQMIDTAVQERRHHDARQSRFHARLYAESQQAPLENEQVNAEDQPDRADHEHKSRCPAWQAIASSGHSGLSRHPSRITLHTSRFYTRCYSASREARQ